MNEKFCVGDRVDVWNDRGTVRGVYGRTLDIAYDSGRRNTSVHESNVKLISRTPKFKEGDRVVVTRNVDTGIWGMSQGTRGTVRYPLHHFGKNTSHGDKVYIIPDGKTADRAAEEGDLMLESDWNTQNTPVEPVEYIVVKQGSKVLHKLPTTDYKFSHSSGGGFGMRDEGSTLTIFKRDRSKTADYKGEEYTDTNWSGNQWAVYYRPAFDSVVTITE